MSRTYEDGVIATLEALHELAPQVSEKVLARVMGVALYKRAKAKGKLRSTGIAAMARKGNRPPARYTVIAGNTTRH